MKDFFDKVQKHHVQCRLLKIVEALEYKSLSIAQISRVFNISRSTTKYYLSLLREANLINYERQEEKPGRPVVVKINKKNLKREKEKTQKNIKYYAKQIINFELSQFILNRLSKGKTSQQKLVEEIKFNYPNQTFHNIFSLLGCLEVTGYVQTERQITQKGKKALKQN